MSGLRRLHWKAEDLKKYQEKKMKFVIKYAYDNVSFYNEKMKDVGVRPDEIKKLDDLSKIPVIRKDEIRQINNDLLISNFYNKDNLKMLRTSGSTGKPFEFYVNNIEDDWRKAIYMRANISCGQRPRDHWSVVTAPRHFYDTTKIQRILGIFAQDCISVFSPVDEQIERLRTGKCDIVDGYSGAIYLIAKELEGKGLDDITPRVMFGSADLIDLPSRRYIESVFNAPYYDQFGCAEVDRTAWQCPERGGYHMDVDSVITEFVDDDGENVASGERGEIVYTSLFNYAMPFIRYSVGDIGIPSDEECPCGRSLPLMEVAEGRKDSLITLSDGRVVSPRTFTVGMSMFEYYSEMDQFRIIQISRSVFNFYIKMKKKISSEEDFIDKIYDHYQKILKLSSDDLEIYVYFVDEIPLGRTGRLNAVISEMN